MLKAISTVKDAGDESTGNLIDRVEEHFLALTVHIQTLLNELVVVDDVLVQGPCVFGKTECREWPLILGEVDRVDRGVADRHGRVFGIDVDWSDVQPKLRRR